MVHLVDIEGLLTIGEYPEDPPAQGNSSEVLRRQAGVDIEGASHPQWHCIHLLVHQCPCLHASAAALASMQERADDSTASSSDGCTHPG